MTVGDVRPGTRARSPRPPGSGRSEKTVPLGEVLGLEQHRPGCLPGGQGLGERRRVALDTANCARVRRPHSSRLPRHGTIAAIADPGRASCWRRAGTATPRERWRRRTVRRYRSPAERPGPIVACSRLRCDPVRREQSTLSAARRPTTLAMTSMKSVARADPHRTSPVGIGVRLRAQRSVPRTPVLRGRAQRAQAAGSEHESHRRVAVRPEPQP
jgi:hypothetical protein